MTVEIHNEQKQVIVWLSNSETNDPELQDEIQKIIHAYSDQKYTVVVFHSGRDNLYGNTLEMLVHNRRVAAQKEARKD